MLALQKPNVNKNNKTPTEVRVKFYEPYAK